VDAEQLLMSLSVVGRGDTAMLLSKLESAFTAQVRQQVDKVDSFYARNLLRFEEDRQLRERTAGAAGGSRGSGSGGVSSSSSSSSSSRISNSSNSSNSNSSSNNNSDDVADELSRRVCTRQALSTSHAAMAKTQHFCASNFAAFVGAFKDYEALVARRLSMHLWVHQPAQAKLAASARDPVASTSSASFVDMAAAAAAYAEPSSGGSMGAMSPSPYSRGGMGLKRESGAAISGGFGGGGGGGGGTAAVALTTAMTSAHAKRCINGAHVLVRRLLGELHARRFVACAEVTGLAAALEERFAVAFCGGSTMAARAELVALERAQRLDQQRRQRWKGQGRGGTKLEFAADHDRDNDDDDDDRDPWGAPHGAGSGDARGGGGGGGGGGGHDSLLPWPQGLPCGVGQGIDVSMSYVLRLTFCAVVLSFLTLLDVGTPLMADPVTFRVFRFCGGVTALVWLVGVSVHVWTAKGINYPFLFEMDRREMPDYPVLYNWALSCLVGLLLAALAYKVLAAWAGAQAARAIPLGCFALFHWRMGAEARPLLAHLGATAIAPFAPVNFFSTMLGDYVTSVVKLLIDYAATWCSLLNGDALAPTWTGIGGGAPDRCLPGPRGGLFGQLIVPVVIALPLWFRFQQCIRRYRDTGASWPNLANALKYALSMMVSLFVIFHPLPRTDLALAQFDAPQKLWLVVLAAAYLYAFWWDWFMDWGLGDATHGYLAPKLTIGPPAAYYAAGVLDLLLRFSWLMTLVPRSVVSWRQDTGFDLTTYLMIGELLRRTMWSFFRVEHEHHSNIWGFRGTELVPAPYDDSTIEDDEGEGLVRGSRAQSIETHHSLLAVLLKRRRGVQWLILLAELALVTMMGIGLHGMYEAKVHGGAGRG
jgi:hypothetical protein